MYKFQKIFKQKVIIHNVVFQKVNSFFAATTFWISTFCDYTFRSFYSQAIFFSGFILSARFCFCCELTVGLFSFLSFYIVLKYFPES